MTIIPPEVRLARSPAMQEAVRALEQAIASGGGVLLRGEPGTGRELFARAIHLARERRQSSVERLLRLSMRGLPPPNGRPFVVLDCTAVNLASQLFGTSAAAAVNGADLERIAAGSAVHDALGGTLLLRQVPQLPAGLQGRLARVLRDGEVRLDANGGETVIPVDARLIGTVDGADDEDSVVPELRKRLSTCTIEAPPLRRRREDIPALVHYLLVDLCASLNLPRKRVSSQALQLLSALPWRGNLTELRELLGTLVQNVPDRRIRVADVLNSVRFDGIPIAFPYGGSLKEARGRFEREYVSHVLRQHQWRISEAARVLGIERTNLYRKLRKLLVPMRGAQRPS